MTGGALLTDLGIAAAILAATLLFYFVLKALWAEIGPMVRLVFRLPSQAALNDDRESRLKK